MTDIGWDKCRDCGGALEVGVMLDHINASSTVAGMWGQGEPEVGRTVRDKRQIPVRAYRCADCGVVRLYAPEA